MERVLQFFKENPVFYLATMDGDQPRVRPFGAIGLFEGKLYFTTGNQKNVYRQMRKNPKIEICGTGKNGDWLRVSATVEFDERREVKQFMLDECPGLKNIYHIDDGIFTVFYLKDATAVFSSFTSEPDTITF